MTEPANLAPAASDSDRDYWPALPADPPPHRLSGSNPEPAAEARSRVISDLRTTAVIVSALGLLGALLGLVWSQWSGPQQRAYVIAPGKLYPYDEVETFVASDGRFLVITIVVGFVAGVLAWRRPGNRGPLVLLALTAGGLLGAFLTSAIGHLSGGGTFDGAPGTTIAQLPLSLHMQGLLFVEAAAAVLVYGVCVSFAMHDDLGRPDHVRDLARSVGPGGHAQYGGGDGDAAGALQQGDLSAQ